MSGAGLVGSSMRTERQNGGGELVYDLQGTFGCQGKNASRKKHTTPVNTAHAAPPKLAGHCVCRQPTPSEDSGDVTLDPVSTPTHKTQSQKVKQCT